MELNKEHTEKLLNVVFMAGVHLWVDPRGKIMGRTGPLGPHMIDAPVFMLILLLYFCTIYALQLMQCSY